jgi:nicotinate-nucleotide adenylyltransferase
MTTRIGLFGGTFDPVHIGHLRSALEVAEQLELDELRLIPGARPPHRGAPQVSARQRLEMVKLAVENVEYLRVDDIEFRRERPSYTIETLEVLRREMGPHVQLLLMLGWDAFCGLPGWHRWTELLDHCHILVLQRPDADSEPPQELCDLIAARAQPDPQALSGPAGQITYIWQTPLAVSATQIRGLLAAGKSVRYLVPDAVMIYIEKHGLYRATT